jgi:hypothetical protein
MIARNSIGRAAIASLLLWTVCGLQLGLKGQSNAGIESIRAAHITIETGMHAPWGDLADRYGISNMVGATFRVKTAGRWLTGFGARFLTGSQVRQPGLLQNLKTEDGYVIDNEGRIARLTAQQRGTLITASVGRLFPTNPGNPNTGIALELAGGLWSHKIHFQNRGNRITQLEAPYLEGYDRLARGWTLCPRVGYWHMDPRGRVNFNVGLECYAGRIAPQRDWNADTMDADTETRTDGLFGIFAGWVIHLRPRPSDELFYD